MKLALTIVLTLTFSSALMANETWDKTKKAINTGAEKIDQGTRKVINKGKAKMEEQQEKKKKEKKSHHKE